MQIILTHENADFDAIASLLAAHKLYPSARPVLPQRVNRNVLAFLALYGPGFPFISHQELPRGQHVQRVILVDTAKLTFVRGMGREISQVTVIDHHTPPEELPAEWQFQGEPLGANVTLLVEAISTRLIPVSPTEATLMLAGIYEDTGNLTYASTTPRDLRAAAWLIDQGADLEVATEFLEHPLTTAQQHIYEGLRDHMETLTIDGHPIILSWADSPPDTEEEISTLAHKLRNLLDPSALFIMVQIGNNVQMVARSATDDINVAAVADHFGGGGHDRAAAALIHDRLAQSLTDELRDLLPAYVRPRLKVRDLMSYGVRTVAPDDTVEKVAQQMLQTGHEGFPVVDPKEGVVGLVTRNAVDRSLQHQLGHESVHRIMRPGSVTVSPGDSVERVRTEMIQTGWGQIPVAANGQIIGVVTRTDMIRLQPSAQTSERHRIAHLMAQAIPDPLLDLIRRIGTEAAEAGYVIYFVGGLVRDLLLGQALVDVDLVVEGDAIALGKAMARAYGGEVRSHSRFGTVKWLLPDDIWRRMIQETDGDGEESTSEAMASPSGRLPTFIDLVTARTEFYEHPTALPLVARSSIKQDLHRRDFTINTLAIRLDPQRWGDLLDFFGGRADLEAGTIRVLHSLSFVDDPTRILRAARFEARLNFHLDQRSESLIADALPLLDRITGERIRHELDLIFQESKPEAALNRLQAFGALRRLCPSLVSDPWLAERFRRLRETLVAKRRGVVSPDDLQQLHWALFTYRLDETEFELLRARLKLPRRLADLHQSRDQVAAALDSLSSIDRPSEITERLEAFDLPALALARLVNDDAGVEAKLIRYAERWRHVQPLLNGDDLKGMGFRPGPLFRDILSALRRARLDGAVETYAEEQALVEARFAPQRTTSDG